MPTTTKIPIILESDRFASNNLKHIAAKIEVDRAIRCNYLAAFMTKYLLLIFALAISLSFVSCDLNKDRLAATKAVDRFHQQFNRSEFTMIYADTTHRFKLSTNETNFVDFLQNVKNKFGWCMVSALSSWRTNAMSGETEVELTYRVIFERGDATETFTYTISGESTLLKNYRINGLEKNIN